MKTCLVLLALCALLACTKSEITAINETKPVAEDTVAALPDTVSKSAGIDTVKKPIDTPIVKPADPYKGKHINYLAFGDSYTIGESVYPFQNFPNQLIKEVAKSGWIINPPTIIAKTGWTTGNLQFAIKELALIQKFDIVTLLIGVNNQYQGESQDIYRKEFKELLQTAIGFAKGGKAHVFVLSIPDWGVTPFGRQSGRDQQTISQEIDAFNAINKKETLALGISYTDITPASRLAASDPRLIASDGLHPSAEMYLNWVVSLAPAIAKVFK